MISVRVLGVVGMFMLLSGCADEAKPSYAECVSREASGDLIAAETACETAVAIDATSESGKAAAVKLKAMQPAIEKAKREKVEADAKAARARQEADQAAREAAAVAEKARWKTMPAILNNKIYEQAKWDLGRGTDTSVLDVIEKEIGPSLASYEESYGAIRIKVWGARPNSTAMADIHATPFSAHILRGLSCGDYTPNKIDYYSYGERVH